MRWILTTRCTKRRRTLANSDGAPRRLARAALCLALALSTACDPKPAIEAPGPTAPAPAAPLQGPSPAARGMEIRGALEDAPIWTEGGVRPQARDRVLLAYQQSFEPMEPLLRSINPDETFALEYAFGALAQQLSRRGDALGTQTAINAVNNRLDSLVRSIPAEALPPDVKPDEELLGPPPTAVEALPPQRDMPTYGEGGR